MKRLLLLVLSSVSLLSGLQAQACEKHLEGHQNSSATSEEARQH
jgi:hypothetical protein